MNTNGKDIKDIKLQPLRGKRPPGLVGRMRRRHLIKLLQEWNENPPEEEVSWEELESTFRHGGSRS